MYSRPEVSIELPTLVLWRHWRHRRAVVVCFPGDIIKPAGFMPVHEGVIITIILIPGRIIRLSTSNGICNSDEAVESQWDDSILGGKLRGMGVNVQLELGGAGEKIKGMFREYPCPTDAQVTKLAEEPVYQIIHP
jgi:hypothetical protein